MCSSVALMTYYSSLMAVTLFFLIASFSPELPWAKCREEWVDYCIDSSGKVNNYSIGNGAFGESIREEKRISSAELYFL